MTLRPAVVVLCLFALQAPAFSQRTPVTSLGHEWLTATAAEQAAKESKDAAKLSGKGNWSGSGCEQGCPGHEYGAQNYLVWSTTLGQRWVDLGGFSMTTAGHRSCWDALTQSPDDLQYDHFLRARDDAGPAGGLKAMNESVKRFRRYFLAAVAEKDGVPLKFMDGGAASGVLAGEFTADRAYFLFGRAAHLFQDSFSLEHAVRKPSDDFTKVYGIKSYVCSAGSPQHGHSAPGTVATLAGFDASKPSRSVAQLGGWGSEPNAYGKNGDVLWVSSVGPESLDNVKPHGRAAQLAMKELWLAFERARARKLAPEAAVDAIIAKWLTVSGNGGDAVPFDFKDCAKEAALKSSKAVDALRTRCLAITGTNRDDASKPPYTWTALGANWPDGDLLDQAGAVAGDAVELAKDAADATKDAVKDGASATKDAVKDAADATRDGAATAKDGAEDAVEDVADATDKTKKSAKKKAKKAKKKAKDALDKAKDTLDDVF